MASSDNPNVQLRTPEPPVVLDDLASSLLDEARASGNGHAAVTLTPAPGGAFAQTLVAITSGGSLDAQKWNGPASVLVLRGKATVQGDGLDTEVIEGGWAPVAGEGAEVRADEDVVALLTAVPHPA